MPRPIWLQLAYKNKKSLPSHLIPTNRLIQPSTVVEAAAYCPRITKANGGTIHLRCFANALTLKTLTVENPPLLPLALPLVKYALLI
jgi:hypothetical protein